MRAFLDYNPAQQKQSCIIIDEITTEASSVRELPWKCRTDWWPCVFTAICSCSVTANVELPLVLSDHSPLLCVSLLSDLIQQHHKCSESRQRHNSSLSWRCEYFVSVCLCLCIIMNWQLVIYNLRGESFPTRSETGAKQPISPLASFFSLVEPCPRLRNFRESNEHRHFVNIIFCYWKRCWMKKIQYIFFSS